MIYLLYYARYSVNQTSVVAFGFDLVSYFYAKLHIGGGFVD